MARRRKTDGSPPGGFTLLELVAVLMVMAILAGAVALSVRGHVSNAQLEAFLTRLEAFDARARSQARRQGQRLALRFDASDQRVSLAAAAADEDEAPAFAVSRGVELAQVRTARQAADYGVLETSVSPFGQSETYALCLQASSGRRVWLVVLGASGQCLRLDEEEEVEQILSLQNDADRHHAG